MRTVLSRLASFSLATAALGMLAPMAGCKKPVYPECKKDKHCKTDLGEKCVDGTCQNCTADEDCVGKGPDGSDWVCADFRCQDPALLGSAVAPGGLGSPCSATTDCNSGYVCTAGVCSACTDDTQCEGGTCDLATGMCSMAVGAGQCSSDSDCAMDEICDAGQCVFSGVEGGANPCGIEAVYFGFDSPKIDADAQGKLDQIASCLSEKGSSVILEAHADPRGTEEYNIMLTDRRGQTVKNYLETKGVTGGNLQVISKGNLEAAGTDESSWAQDRRVEFVFP